jgi:tetratricopeptide (TPR) repeat protein
MFILNGFNSLLMALLTFYVFYRMLKTRKIIMLVSFTLQLSALTIVILSLVNHVNTSNNIEIFYIMSGIFVPCCLIFKDYKMNKRSRVEGSFEGFIQAKKSEAQDSENSVEIMSVITNENSINETIFELGLIKEDLFKGMRRKLIQAENSYNEGSYDNSCQIYTTLIGLFNTSSNLYFNYGNVCFKRGRLSDAVTQYRKVLELNEQLISNHKTPDLSRHSQYTDPYDNIKYKEHLVYTNLGITYLNMGKAELALENFHKALEINPDCAPAKEGIGRAYTQSGNKSQAIKYYEEILQKDKNNYGVSMLLGKLLTETDGNTGAEDSVEIDGDTGIVSSSEAEDTGGNCSSVKAREHFERCIRKNPRNPEAYIELGRLLMSQRDFEEAVNVYKTYLTIKDNDYNGHYNLAGCYQQIGEYDKAIEEYRQAIGLNPKSCESIFNLGIIFEKKNEDEKAIECYKAVIQIQPDFADAYNNLGVLYSRDKRQVEALAAYTGGIKASPGNFGLYYNMGIVLFDLKRYEDAADAFRQAIEINPQDKDIYYYLGASMTELKLYDDAIGAYSKALDDKMGEGELYYNIAAVYALMKKQDIALDNLKKAVSKEPGIKREICQNSVFDYMWTISDFVELVS